MTIATFLFFTILVAVLTWWFTRGSDNKTDEGYFLAGRSLTGVFIAGSLLLTNLSTEQLIGLNAGAFKEGLSVMAWEVVAGFSLVILGLVFLPRYLKSGIATIPQFLEERYGTSVRTLTALIFIVAYTLILLPFVLYAGARGLSDMLDLPLLLGYLGQGEAELLSEEAYKVVELKTIWTVTTFIACVGAAYAIWGGLKAVAVSDTFNGAGLLIGGLMITFFSLSAIAGSETSIWSSFEAIKAENPDAFQSMGKAGEDIHWPTLFTGVLLLNFFYWCTNQQIIQRTFGAKNLAEGQKGVLLAAFFKILAPIILVLPGIVAAHMFLTDDSFKAQLSGADNPANSAYGVLVKTVLPAPLVGFFAAVVVGSILSTFNSVLNSSATLFSLDVYKKFINPKASMQQVVRSGRICSLLVGVFAVIAAPTIFYGRESVFNFFQNLNGVYFIPLLAVILIGMINRWVDGRSAMITLIVGLSLMVLGTFFTGAEELSGYVGWVKSYFGSPFHYMGAVFLGLIALQLGLAKFAGMSRSEAYVQQDAKAVDLTPWKPAPIVGGLLIVFALSLYILFSL